MHVNNTSKSEEAWVPGEIQRPCDEKMARIYDAFLRGVFTLYEQPLKQHLDKYWSRTTWLDCIGQFAKGDPEENIKAYLLPCYLFTIAIDPEIEEEDKKLLFEAALQTLEKKEMQSLSCQLDGLPLISSNIIRYCSHDVLKNAIKMNLMFPYVEPLIFSWIEEVMRNTWAMVEKQAFLDKLFATMTEEAGNDMFFYLLLKREGGQFLNLCPEVLANRFKNAQEEIVQFGKALLSGSEKEVHAMEFSFSSKLQQQYFLEWFFKNALHHAQSDLIAIKFEDGDWKWLHHRFETERQAKDPFRFNVPFRRLESSPSPLIPLAMKWMIGVSKKLPSLLADSTDKDYCISLFYHCASDYIDEEKGWKHIPPEDYRALAEVFKGKYLYGYFDSLDAKLRKYIIKHNVENHPHSILTWLDKIFGRSNEHCKASDKVLELVALISKTCGLKELISLIFDSKRYDPILKLNVYVRMYSEDQKAVLEYVLLDKKKGIEALAEWISLTILGQFSDNGIKSYVKFALLVNFYKILSQVDPKIPKLLKDSLMSQMQHSPESIEYLDLLFPVEVDLEDPINRQNEAIKKLKLNFQTPGIANHDRQSFVSRLMEDLKSGLSTSQMVVKLFEALPKETWPLIFYYFDDGFCYSHYDNYYEEKSKGGVFNKVQKDSPIRMDGPEDENRGYEMVQKKFDQMCLEPGIENINLKLEEVLLWSKYGDMLEKFKKVPRVEKGFSDPDQWIDKAAQTLLQMSDNPYLNGADKYDEQNIIAGAMRTLYQAACETNSIYPIISRFMENVSADQFFPIMDRFCEYGFHYNFEGFKTLIAGSFDKAKIKKITFIANLIMLQDDHIGMFNVYELLKEPFLKDDKEKAQVIKKLISGMGIQFLSLFNNRSNIISSLVKSLHLTDPDYCQLLFIESVICLSSVANENVEKFIVFQSLCDAYTEASIDALQYLSDKKLKKFHSHIDKWFSFEILSQHLNICSPLGLRLLQFFKRDLFYPVILKKIKLFFSNEKYISFNEFDMILVNLEKLNCSEYVFNRLREDKPKVLERIKKTLEKDLIQHFYRDRSPFYIPWICQLVPDWCEHLQASIVEEMSKANEQALKAGDKPSFDFTRIFEILSSHGKLDQLLLGLPLEALPESFVSHGNLFKGA